MLRWVCGDSAFFAGCRNYLNDPDLAYGSAYTADLQAHLEAARGKDLDGFMDLYLGLEYRYTKRLSLFLDVSNLSASKYERWYQYPVKRTLLLGGATYAF
mgnify:CR=1 FL=1